MLPFVIRFVALFSEQLLPQNGLDLLHVHKSQYKLREIRDKHITDSIFRLL